MSGAALPVDPTGLTERPRGYRRWGLVGLVLAAGLLWAAAAAWRALPLSAREAFLPRPELWTLAFLVQTPGWLLAVDAWRRMLAATRPAAEVVAAEARSLASGAVGDEKPASSAAALAAIPFAEHLLGHGLTALAQTVPGSIWAPLTRVAFYRERQLGALWTGGAMLLEMSLLGGAGLLLVAAALPAMAGEAPATLPALGLAGILALLLLHPRVFGALLHALGKGLRLSTVPTAPPGLTTARLLVQESMVLVLSAAALFLVVRGLLPSAAHLPTLAAAWGLGVAIASLLAFLPATALLKDGGMLALLTPLCLPAAEGRLWVATGLALGITMAWRLWTLFVLAVWTMLAALWVRRQGRRLRTALDPVAAAGGEDGDDPVS